MDLSAMLGSEPITDPDEEAFVVFSQDIPSSSLGFIDAHAESLELTVAGVDLVIHQSRGLLTSDRKAGTTGAVVWAVTPRFAEWIAAADNLLFTSGLLSSSSKCIELGSGISGIVALTLGAKIARFTATDQDYAMKLLRQNITSNLDAVFPAPKKAGRSKQKPQTSTHSSTRITADILDWEEDSVEQREPVDLVVACDCIYIEALIEPLNTTCASICKLNTEAEKPTLCVVAQQLRSPDVFEAWLKSFHRLFHTWQVPDRYLTAGLRENSGFVVHVGVVRR
ncbi:Ribosomal protein lysine methyltransferase [Ascochyta lentis]